MKCPKCGYTPNVRSIEQNKLSHAYYKLISEQLGQDTPKGVKQECKLRFGVPILRRDDPDFKEIYDTIIKPRSYEEKLKVMEYLPITSIMKVGQLQEYIAEIEECYRTEIDFSDQNRGEP